MQGAPAALKRLDDRRVANVGAADSSNYAGSAAESVTRRAGLVPRTVAMRRVLAAIGLETHVDALLKLGFTDTDMLSDKDILDDETLTNVSNWTTCSSCCVG